MSAQTSVPGKSWRGLPLQLAGACAAMVLAATPAQQRDLASAADIEIVGEVAPPVGAEPGLVLNTDSGRAFHLVSNRMSLALFVDTNLHHRALRLKGRVSEGQPARFEVTGNLRAIRNGKTVELYYYCDICAIKGSDPGPCVCCREPVRLVEAPPGGELH